MRLIDADELKKTLKEKCCLYCRMCDEYSVFENGVHYCRLIDIAPTIRNEYMRGYEAAMRECKRPQGKWIDIEEYDDYPNKKVCECSECGKMISISRNDFPNFCENCGADMRGEK